jgi:hypothetical protein
MPNRLKRLVFLSSLAVALLASAGTADATTATVTGGPTLSGTATSSLYWKLHNSGKTQSCTGATMSATLAASSSGTIPPGIVTSSNLQMSMTGCTIVGGLGITVSCDNTARLRMTRLTSGGSTPAAITGIVCHIFLTTQTACAMTVTGSMGVTYRNAPGTLNTDVNHQSLSSAGTCSFGPIGPDSSVRFSGPTSGDLQYNVSPTNLAINVS